MPPKTTRALRVTVLAAGLAAAGTSTASATTAPALEGLKSAPDEIGKHAVINPCRSQDAPEPQRCPEVEAGAKTPTVLKQVGVHVVRGGEQLKDDLTRPGSPDGRVGRALGDVAGVAQGVQEQTKTRPNVDATVRPGENPLLQPKSPHSAFVDAHVSPRGPSHKGVSALDTAVDSHAVEGYDIGRGTLPEALVPSLPPEAGVPAHPIPAEAGVPKAAVSKDAVSKNTVPAAKSGPAAGQSAPSQLDSRVLGPAQQAAGDVVHRVQGAGQAVDAGAGDTLHGKSLPLQLGTASLRGH